MAYIRLVNGTPEPFNPSKRNLYNFVKRQCWPWPCHDSILADYDIYPLADTQKPVPGQTQYVAETAPALVNGVWSRQWEVLEMPFEEAKEAVARRISDKRDAIFAAGYSPATGPLAGHTLQTRGIEDRTNWLTSQAAYSAAVAAGAGSLQEAYFRTAANETVALSYADGLAALLGMAAWGKAVMGNSWTLKDEVESASDNAALAAIDIEAGWP